MNLFSRRIKTSTKWCSPHTKWTPNKFGTQAPETSETNMRTITNKPGDQPGAWFLFPGLGWCDLDAKWHEDPSWSIVLPHQAGSFWLSWPHRSIGNSCARRVKPGLIFRLTWPRNGALTSTRLGPWWIPRLVWQFKRKNDVFMMFFGTRVWGTLSLPMLKQTCNILRPWNWSNGHLSPICFGRTPLHLGSFILMRMCVCVSCSL